jgi:hypothetical protein
MKPNPIIRWLWTYKTTTGFWVVHKTFFTDAEAFERMGDGCFEFFKLEYTQTEFPE